jgi:DNA-binding NtrC family response regulator
MKNGESAGRTTKVLVVEDEALIRLALVGFMTESGLEVLEASCAAEAIGVLQSEANGVGVVFSDIRMPGELDGLGLLSWVRDNREGVAMILTSGDLKQANAAKELGANADFVAKPYTLHAARGAILRALTGSGCGADESNGENSE